ncbi:tetratricopeptide repeat-containing sensor histidine kinase, partial [Bacteroidales bacterium AH-315-N07]|nr:tetratricopeptide repeat-containing sensor histidine kinase [Bacteroidales bacterium AH-315-N07]
MKRIFISIFALLFVVNVSGQNQAEIDSLENLLQNSKNDTNAVLLLHKLAWQLKTNNPPKALLYAEQQLRLSKKLNFERGKATAYNDIGIINDIQGNFSKALESHLKSLKINEKTGDKKGIAVSYNNIGIFHWNKGNYSYALKYFFKALKLEEEIGNKGNIARYYNNIGAIYDQSKNYTKAEDFYLKSLKMYIEAGNESGVAYSYGNIGLVHVNQKDYLLGLEYLFKSLEIQSEKMDKWGIAKTSTNIGKLLTFISFSPDTIYDIIKDSLNILIPESKYENGRERLREQALGYFLKSVQISEEMGDKRISTYPLYGIADLYVKQGRAVEALPFIQQGIAVAKEIGAEDDLRAGYQIITIVYEQLQAYQAAYNYHKLYTEVKDSIFNEDSQNSLNNLKIQFETEKKEKEIELLQKDQNIKEMELTKRRNQQYAMGGVIAIVLIMAFLLYNRYRIKQKTNKKLTDAYDKLKELENFKESMTGMIVHDLKNPLNSIIGLTTTEKMEENSIKQVNQSGKQMLNMVMNMLDVQKFEDTEVKLAIEDHLAYKLSQQAIQQVSVLAKEKGIQITNNIIHTRYVSCDPEIMIRVFENILTNAIKYTPTSGKIKLGSKSVEQNKLIISISDTGTGIPKDKLEQVFDKFAQLEAKKSGVARPTGIGLTFCKLVIEAHGGKIWVDSEEDKGT